MLVLHCVYTVSPWSVVRIPPKSEPVELCLLRKTPVIARSLKQSLAGGSAIPLMTLCWVSRKADASAAGCVSSGDLGMGKPRAEFRKNLGFLSTSTVAESGAERMMSPVWWKSGMDSPELALLQIS